MTRAAAQGAEAVMIYVAIESGDLRRDECTVSFIEINVLHGNGRTSGAV